MFQRGLLFRSCVERTGKYSTLPGLPSGTTVEMLADENYVKELTPSQPPHRRVTQRDLRMHESAAPNAKPGEARPENNGLTSSISRYGPKLPSEPERGAKVCILNQTQITTIEKVTAEAEPDSRVKANGQPRSVQRKPLAIYSTSRLSTTG